MNVFLFYCIGNNEHQKSLLVLHFNSSLVFLKASVWSYSAKDQIKKQFYLSTYHMNVVLGDSLSYLSSSFVIKHMPDLSEIDSSYKPFLAQKPCILQMITLRSARFQKVFYNRSRRSPLTCVSRAVKPWPQTFVHFWSGMLAVAACEVMFCVGDQWCVNRRQACSEVISPGNDSVVLPHRAGNQFCPHSCWESKIRVTGTF